MKLGEKLSIPPTMLGLITTRKCSAACRNCCFECSPKEVQRLSLDEMEMYVDEAMSSYDSIQTVILTGGRMFVYCRG